MEQHNTADPNSKSGSFCFLIISFQEHHAHTVQSSYFSNYSYNQMLTETLGTAEDDMAFVKQWTTTV